ncbi:hypothetical protein MVES1_001611 [Malassezia vespertilionis]|uniref:uncharacterized protein n=1 Tax=Malassezia vespertilionis TaxID=2020962 RepID=UPI0024B1342A|nr:uncharacterized protein MVES1_001611 [Malassezia vespertilionis]WFD06266.1 hypothetical protein MVES1_001611 [Malassezia vespertilionis]
MQDVPRRRSSYFSAKSENSQASKTFDAIPVLLYRVENAQQAVYRAIEEYTEQDALEGKLHNARVEAAYDNGDKQVSLDEEGSIGVRVQDGAEGPEEDPFLVTWKSTNAENENPRSWSYRYRLRVMGIYALFSGVGPWASSMVSPALNTLDTELGFNNSVTLDLVLAIYLIAFFIGPLFSAPISENLGRKRLALFCNVFFIIFNIGCAVARTPAQLVVLRFFAGLFSGATVPMGGSAVSDMFDLHERGFAMSLYTIAPVLGPCMGPLVAGWIIQGWSPSKWPWIFWTSTMMAGVIMIVGLLFMRETYAPRLLREKARKLRESTGDNRYHSIFDKQKETPKQKLERVMLRPIVFLSTEILVFLPALYVAIIYGCFYLLVASMPRVFQEKYGYKVGISALHNLALGIGLVCFGQAGGVFIDVVYKRLCKKYGHKRPEYKLPLLMISVFVMPCALLLFGWTAQYHVVWIVPDIGLVLAGGSVICTIIQGQMYMADLMGVYASSSLSAMMATRSLMGFAMVLIAKPLFDRLDIGWGLSVVALITAIFGIPSPFILYKYGYQVRQRSKYATKL